jgi:hypothetical protein
MPRSAVALKSRFQNGMVVAWARCMACVNQTRPHCVNQIGKTKSKPLAVRHGRGMVCVNQPRHPLNMTLGGPHSHSSGSGEEKNVSLLPGFETPRRSPVVPTTPSRPVTA